jgi:hypothetical protein
METRCRRGKLVYYYVSDSEEGLMTKYFKLALLVTVASIPIFTPVDAREGCGLGRHRGVLGACHDNAAPIVVAPLAAAVVAPDGAVVVAPRGRVCPHGWHLRPGGRCRRN